MHLQGRVRATHPGWEVPGPATHWLCCGLPQQNPEHPLVAGPYTCDWLQVRAVLHMQPQHCGLQPREQCMYLQHQLRLQPSRPPHRWLRPYIETVSRKGGSWHCTSEHLSLSRGSDCSGVRVEGIWAIASGPCGSPPGCTPHACKAVQPLPREVILATVA